MTINFNNGIRSIQISAIGKITYVTKTGTADSPGLKFLVSCNTNMKPAEGEKYAPSQTFGCVLWGKAAQNAVEYNLVVKGNAVQINGEFDGINGDIINLRSYGFNYAVLGYVQEEGEVDELAADSVEEKLEAPPKKFERSEAIDLV